MPATAKLEKEERGIQLGMIQCSHSILAHSTHVHAMNLAVLEGRGLGGRGSDPPYPP